MMGLLTEKFYSKNPKRWFKSILKSVEELPEHPYYKKCVCYELGDEIVFEYNEKYGNFWIDYLRIWSIFENKFGLNYDEIQLLIKCILEEHYKLKELKIIGLGPNDNIKLGAHYKLKNKNN